MGGNNTSGKGGGETRLPFAVDEVLLQGGAGNLWAVVGRQPGADAVSVVLGAVASPPQAQLDGFKSRALRAEAPTQRHLYTTEWRQIEVAGGVCAEVLLSLIHI